MKIGGFGIHCAQCDLVNASSFHPLHANMPFLMAFPELCAIIGLKCRVLCCGLLRCTMGRFQIRTAHIHFLQMFAALLNKRGADTGFGWPPCVACRELHRAQKEGGESRGENCTCEDDITAGSSLGTKRRKEDMNRRKRAVLSVYRQGVFGSFLTLRLVPLYKTFLVLFLTLYITYSWRHFHQRAKNACPSLFTLNMYI